jgi:thiazole synthase
MFTLTLNGEACSLPAPLTVAGLLEHLGHDRRRVAVEVNQAVVPASRHAEHVLQAGDQVEIVTLVGGGAGDVDGVPDDKPLLIGPYRFRSRLFTGTGKYSTYEAMRSCLAASGCEVTTVAVRRERLIDKEGRSILDFLDLKRYTILPNTAGCFNAADAIRSARLGRELLGNLGNPGADWIKLECLGDARTASVMPAGSPIGSGQGVLNPNNIRIILEYLKDGDPDYPVIVDAGVGGASDVSAAMELGCDGVLLNTAVAHAKDPIRMAHAMRLACEAGRLSYLAGRIPKKLYAQASSPMDGRIGTGP